MCHLTAVCTVAGCNVRRCRQADCQLHQAMVTHVLVGVRCNQPPVTLGTPVSITSHNPNHSLCENAALATLLRAMCQGNAEDDNVPRVPMDLHASRLRACGEQNRQAASCYHPKSICAAYSASADPAGEQAALSPCSHEGCGTPLCVTAVGAGAQVTVD